MQISLQMGRQMALAPALQRSLQFLQMNALEFEQEVRAALESNPLLELADEADGAQAALDADAETTADGIESGFGESTEDRDAHDSFEDSSASATGEPEDGRVDADATLQADGSADEPSDDPFDALDSQAADAGLDAAAGESDAIDDLGGPDEFLDDTSVFEADATTDWQTSSSNGSSDDDAGPLDFVARHSSLREHLWAQLRATSCAERIAACSAVIIDSLDDNGYLGDSWDELRETAQGLGIDCVGDDELDEALVLVQSFEPAGIAARDVRECLLLQIDGLRQTATAPTDRHGDNRDALLVGLELADRIVDEQLETLASGDFRALAQVLQADEVELADATRLIRSLNPRPGESFKAERIEYAVPEVIVRKVGRRFVARLHPAASPRIRIHTGYADAIASMQGREDVKPLQGKLQEARWLMRSIDQRAGTIEKTAQAIVARQQRFFEYGDIGLVPMRLADIAADVGIHESTVSRVVNSKYLQGPSGLIPMKRFFTSHVETSAGQACSATAVKAMIRQLIASEAPGNPVSDHRLAKMLDQRGIRIARRTVTKYRDALGIDAVEMRKHSHRPGAHEGATADAGLRP